MPLPVSDTAPLERRLLRDVVYTRLYEGILDGTLEPGETLLDDKLTAWLGVSRTPIREALMRLADIGLVEMAPNRYTRVTPIDLKAIDEAVYTTGLLHEHAARTIVPTLTASTVTALDKAQKQLRKAAKANDLTGLGRAFNDFFRELVTAGSNEVLVSVTDGLGPQLLRYLSVWQRPFGVDDLAESVAEIFAAIKERDGTAAGDRVKALYAGTLKQFLQDYRHKDADIDRNPVF